MGHQHQGRSELKDKQEMEAEIVSRIVVSLLSLNSVGGLGCKVALHNVVMTTENLEELRNLNSSIW